MSLRTILLLLLLPLLSVGNMQALESTDFLPAGMLLQCVVDEPNFSLKTAEIGDPILCHLGTTTAFGRQAFPSGSYLTGHLEDAKAPGHFFGKGSLTVQFDRLVLPGQAALPLAAKVISVPKYKVERNGAIDGKGHAKRDAVEWAIPILWPVKVLTLPARGPYPALKGEVRITLRLMQDTVLPRAIAAYYSVPTPPWANPASPARPTSTVSRDAQFRNAAYLMPPQRTLTGAMPSGRKDTILVMKDQSAHVVQKYWLEGDQIRCLTANGENRMVPVTSLDFTETARINRERSVLFVLQSR